HSVVVAGDAARHLAAERDVRSEFDAATGSAARKRIRGAFAEHAVDSQLGLIADVANGTGERAGAEQGALWTAQHFDAGDVEQVDVRSEQRQRDRHAVEIDADLLLHAGLVTRRLA